MSDRWPVLPASGCPSDPSRSCRASAGQDAALRWRATHWRRSTRRSSSEVPPQMPLSWLVVRAYSRHVLLDVARAGTRPWRSRSARSPDRWCRRGRTGRDRCRDRRCTRASRRSRWTGDRLRLCVRATGPPRRIRVTEFVTSFTCHRDACTESVWLRRSKDTGSWLAGQGLFSDVESDSFVTLVIGHRGAARARAGEHAGRLPGGAATWAPTASSWMCAAPPTARLAVHHDAHLPDGRAVVEPAVVATLPEDGRPRRRPRRLRRAGAGQRRDQELARRRRLRPSFAHRRRGRRRRSRPARRTERPRFVVSCFHLPTVDRVRELAPDLVTALAGDRPARRRRRRCDDGRREVVAHGHRALHPHHALRDPGAGRARARRGGGGQHLDLRRPRPHPLAGRRRASTPSSPTSPTSPSRRSAGAGWGGQAASRAARQAQPRPRGRIASPRRGEDEVQHLGLVAELERLGVAEVVAVDLVGDRAVRPARSAPPRSVRWSTQRLRRSARPPAERRADDAQERGERHRPHA